ELAGLFAGTSVSFDLSVFELLVPLSRGGRVLLGEDSLALADLPAAGAVRLVNTVPSAAAELVRLEALPASVATVNLAGEPLPRDLVDRIYAGSRAAKVYNLYGPSEDTTYSTVELVPRDDPAEPAIGRPVAGTRALVLDPGLRPVPAGVPGELCLAGAGLARGYLGRPARTAESFVPDPRAGAAGAPAGGRVYRTGDLVRHLPDGRLAFLGRMDHQVKLRGFRIELGEIESALAALPGVAAAAVLLRRDGPGDGRLVAYVAGAPEGPSPREEELAAHLRQALPAYMVPPAWAVLPELPLTPNGKIDRRALAAIEPSAAGSEDEVGPEPGQAPRTPEEEILAELWADLLGVERVGVRRSFFELGGHSLLATRLLARVRRLFGVEVPLRALFEAPTVEALAERVVRGRRDAAADPERAAPPVTLLPRGRLMPASFGQERLWFLHHLGEDGGSYNLSGALALRGGLRSPALARALRGVVRRHEALRTVFAPATAAGAGEAQVLQVVLERVTARLPLLDLGGLPPVRRGPESRRASEALAGRPFSLGGDRGPLFRFALLRLGADEHLLAAVFHHAVSDGWSVEVFLRDLSALYGAALAGRPSPLPELPVQYPDFAAWQREQLSGAALDGEIVWWREHLAGLPPLLDLPTDRPRPPVRDARGGRLPVRLAGDVVAPLRELARSRGASLYMVCLALFQAVLGRLAGADHLAVGAPVAGRTRAEVDGLIGLFVNTLVLRGDLTGDPSFAELLGRARGTVLDAYAHQELPFEKLVEELRPERSLGHSPLFQTLLTVQNAPGKAPALTGLETEPVDVGRGGVKFDLRLGLKERRGGLEGEFEFRRDLFDATTVARWRRQLEALARAAAAEPDRPLSELPLLPAAERHALLHEWSGVPSGRPEARSLAELVARRAAERPEAVAVEGREGSLSYGELLRRAEALAGRLTAAGAGPDRPVAVYLERSPDLAVTLLAAARAGAPAVPLDPDYPAARVAFMLEDSGAAAVVTTEALRPGLPETSARVLDPRLAEGEAEEAAGVPLPELASPLLAAAPAYVLYTSGSTGRPNGVAVPQAAVAEHLRAMAEALPLSPADTVLWKTPAGFDPSVWELWAPLAAGARLALARPGAHRDPEAMAEALRRHRASVLRLVPTLFEAMLEAGGLAGAPALRRLFVGGDVLPPGAAGRFLAASGAELVNSYGPTETTVTAAWHRVRPEDAYGPVPLGRPVGSLRAYALDVTLGPVPAGAAGELALAGPTLATCYRGRPGRTAERFVPDPFGGEAGGRLYRTGDRVRLRPDGRLAFLGRLDHQVKIRGGRVEPGEVEALLAAQPGVERAAAVVRGDAPGEARLVAYAVLAASAHAGAEDAAALARELRDRLARRLPPAMVPAAVVVLPELPLLPNGKVDRRALAAGGGALAAGRDEGERVPPRGPLETMVAEVWSEVLGVDGVGAHEDFFHLGGHSLLATRVVARLRERTGVELPLRRLFEERTVAGLAACLGGALGDAGAEAAADGPLRALPRDRPLPAPRRLRGPLDLPALARAFGALARRHESLRTTLLAAEGEPPAGQPESAAVQVVHPPAPVPLPVVDLAALPA
ncbi:MAG TPA: amino acid adenylation domain-containing protein, partial [Thermoanaerobaculia bacterium]